MPTLEASGAIFAHNDAHLQFSDSLKFWLGNIRIFFKVYVRSLTFSCQFKFGSSSSICLFLFNFLSPHVTTPCFSGFIGAQCGRNREWQAYSTYPRTRTLTSIFLTSDSQWVGGSFSPPLLSYPSPETGVLITGWTGEVAVLQRPLAKIRRCFSTYPCPGSFVAVVQVYFKVNYRHYDKVPINTST